MKNNLQRSCNSDDGERNQRFHHAFWIQNDIATIGPQVSQEDDTENKTYAKLNPVWQKTFTDNEDTYLHAEFIAMCVRVVRKLHNEGVIKKALGRPVPVLIHELEYNDDIATQTEEANPKGLTSDFSEWLRGM